MANICKRQPGIFLHPYAVSAGASGAVLGVAGSIAGYLYWKDRLEHLPILGKAFVSIFLVIAFSLRSSSQSDPNQLVDLAAHLGGLASGFLLGILYAKITPDPIWLNRDDA